MKIRFSIHYSTEWGQSMHVVVAYHYFNGKKRTYDIPMTTTDGNLWTVESSVVESRQRSIKAFEYFYQVENDDGEMLRKEWSRFPRYFYFDSTKDYILPDCWHDLPLQNHMLTKAFRTCNKIKEPETYFDERIPVYRKTIIFRVLAPQLTDGQSLAVCGNHPSIGNWNPAQFLRMHRLNAAEWELSINVDNIFSPIEYKYVVVDDADNRLIAWEEGNNRTTAGYKIDDGQVLVLTGKYLRVRETEWRTAGVVVPVFSLRTSDSFGVGDFGDLHRFVDWAVLAKIKMIQLLPVCDTTTTHTWSDSHPYDCISLHALHPHYMNLQHLGELDDAAQANKFRKRQRELNSLDYSDYEAVDRLKINYISEIFRQRGKDDLASADYRKFYSSNAEWLFPYAAFCALREHYHTARTSDWHEFAKYDKAAIQKHRDTDADFKHDFDVACFTQYHLYKQLTEVSRYAREKGISLCGDLPVGLYRDSVVTWQQPELFHLNAKLGNPPSATEPLGQDWGMPPFDWYPDNGRPVAAYLRAVLGNMEHFFDVVRIDHIVSFFRCWEIPRDNLWASMGHFVPSLPLSVAEIKHYGMEFHHELYTRPFINDAVIRRFFGIHADYVRENYLVRRAYHLYDLKPECDTQLKIKQLFEGRRDENSLWIRYGLMHLCANVLFLPDNDRQGLYYPRYGVFNEPVYSILSQEEKDAFVCLYNNYYYERHNEFWKYHAKRKLSAVLRHTRMLVYAEDLGMLPACVPEVLDEQRILSLRVQSMPNANGQEFAHLEAYPYRSVAIPTTHDMSPLRLWWEENPARTQRFWTQMLQKEGNAPRHLPPLIAEEIISRHLYCPSMICMLSIQDWLAMDSSFERRDVYELRINAPYDAYNKWKYRMRTTIDELLASDQYDNKVATMVTRSKRA